ncbi:recombinase family protein [Anaeromicropila populeti]|uniref:Site-specific DNA recombinase n=1 Tax=Anaeromicropila populeti TaxID=37658 RepID=A0A1I6KRS8_9FIRM|nr:recombinase family protein [Anaeromicropila populeti]SFR93620.1 Site-specific DNA recombinase [Anaeromicropila populeti]
MNSKTMQYYAALYLRLSKDDDGAMESASITTQKKMLIAYAKEKGFRIVDIYIDDGYSGTNFERPEFKRMIRDIERKKVNMVITKDLSRLGRDYITTGQYTEIFFPVHEVRYIAVNDGYDSESLHNDIAPFKNIVNEMYARDISQKIKSSFETKMREGSFIGNFAPYGYKKAPDNKNQLIVDETAASVVKKIFHLAEEGSKPKEIADLLNESKILTPALYRCLSRPYLNVENYTKRKEWTSSTISKILKNMVYLGHMVQGKTTKVSFKSQRMITAPRERWIIVEHTHEPIISQKTFEKVRWQMTSRRSCKKGNFQNIFSGIAKCMDCGKNMSTTGTRKKGTVTNLVCGGYKLFGSKECSNHFVDYGILYQIVLNEIKKQIILSDEDRQVIGKVLKNRVLQVDGQESDRQNKKISCLKARDRELDFIIKKLYEDTISGKISEERFRKLSGSYEEEQKDIKEEILQIQQKIAYSSTSKPDDEMVYNLLSKYLNVTELTQEILYELVDRIEIGQGGYEQTPEGKRKRQEIKIYYKFMRRDVSETV